MSVVELVHGDSRDVLAMLPTASIDAVATDPPYALVSIGKRFGAEDAAPAMVGATGAYARASRGFMGKTWDTGEVAFSSEFWREVYRVLKPGGHVAAFGGTRTEHRMTCAIEDAGFEIRDKLVWMYGTGFPKSHDVSKGIDKAAGADREVVATGAAVKRMIPGADQNKVGWEKNNGREYIPNVSTPATDAARQWAGWGTALKPAWEPIVLARKPLIGTVAANVLAHGTGALNIDGCRVGGESTRRQNTAEMGYHGGNTALSYATGSDAGRWPANLVHDGSDEVLACFPREAGAQAPVHRRNGDKLRHTYGAFAGDVDEAGSTFRGDSGSAARFFYSAKASKADRAGSKHPTVKPVKLMRWIVRLITPPGGVVLDPFAGSGTTGQAAREEGFGCILVEREAEYADDIRRRLGLPGVSVPAAGVGCFA